MAPDMFDPDVVVRRLTRDAKTRLSADAVAVWLFGIDGSELALRAALGFTHESTARALAHRPFEQLGEWLTSRRLPSITTVRASSGAAHAWLVDESIRSMLVAPLAAGGTRVGLLAAFRRRRSFSAAHLAVARELTDASAVPILAAVRVAEEREHAERAETLLAVTQTLAAASDLSAALDEVPRRTAAALAADRCEIALADTPAAMSAARDPGRSEEHTAE